MLYLASGSKKRAELLRQAGYKFKIIVTGITERWNFTLSPEENVKQLAYRKALAAAEKIREGTIIAADTIVVFGKHIVRKPRSKAHAIELLKSMRGKTQWVLTGVCLLDKRAGKCRLFCGKTLILCRRVPDSMIEEYVNSGRGMGRAGGYAVEGRNDKFVKILKGSLTNVMGLPMGRIKRVYGPGSLES
ncbi:MAG: septum formation protein Maf [Planctomycetes bacterium]|nr:septum formation protein Maf [Planctomycetota bacterium]